MTISDLANDREFATERAEILKALANPIRLRIIARLAGGGEESVTNLGNALGLPQAKVSQQLAALRAHGIVRVRKDNTFHFYSLAIPQMADMLTCLSRSCRPAAARR
jgi:ArsR family transcriptional regulator